MTSKPLSCNEKTKKTPTSCVFPVKHLLWVEFNINIKPQNISSRALQHFWSHDCAISWQRHVFYNLLLLSLIRPCCTSRPLQTQWTLDFQLVLKFTQNLSVKVISTSILSIPTKPTYLLPWCGRQNDGDQGGKYQDLEGQPQTHNHLARLSNRFSVEITLSQAFPCCLTSGLYWESHPG